MAAELDLQRAQLASDTNALARLLHNHLRFIGPDAQVHDKASDLAAHEAALVVFKASRAIEIEVHVFETTGLTIALLELVVDVDGETVAGSYRYTRTWLFDDDRWQIVGGAIVRVPQAPIP
jgi:hypothetical protein